MILCCGEALIDMLPRRSDQGEDVFAPYAGGAVFNTAIALGRLGTPAGFFCALSTDFMGDLLARNLSASNVDHSLAPRVDRPTTLAFVQLDDGHAKYAFFDENSALRLMTEAELPDLPVAVEALFFGGISLTAGPSAGAFEALMMRERDARATMIDPNIRPTFIRDEAEYRARMDRMIAAADIVKLSDEDLHWLYGAGDTAALAEQVRATGPAIVCITEGSKGVTGYTAGGAVFQAANRAEVVDTVGAGDTFNAGLLSSLHGQGVLTRTALHSIDETRLRTALARGAEVAAVTVSRAGANPPWASEL